MAMQKREVKLNYGENSKEAKLERIMDELCGKATYYDEYDPETGKVGKTTVVREEKLNEYGGKTYVHMYRDIVTVTKCDAKKQVQEKYEKHIDEFEI